MEFCFQWLLLKKPHNDQTSRTSANPDNRKTSYAQTSGPSAAGDAWRPSATTRRLTTDERWRLKSLRVPESSGAWRAWEATGALTGPKTLEDTKPPNHTTRPSNHQPEATPRKLSTRGERRDVVASGDCVAIQFTQFNYDQFNGDCCYPEVLLIVNSLSFASMVLLLPLHFASS